MTYRRWSVVFALWLSRLSWIAFVVLAGLMTVSGGVAAVAVLALVVLCSSGLRVLWSLLTVPGKRALAALRPAGFSVSPATVQLERTAIPVFISTLLPATVLAIISTTRDAIDLQTAVLVLIALSTTLTAGALLALLTIEGLRPRATSSVSRAMGVFVIALIAASYAIAPLGRVFEALEDLTVMHARLQFLPLALAFLVYHPPAAAPREAPDPLGEPGG